MTMEELLNKLIEKGWKPFGNKKIEDAKTARWNINLLNEEVNKVSKFKDKVAFTNGVLIFDEINLRELVSKESGLRQFVCNNGLIPEDRKCHERVLDLTFGPNGPDVSAQMCSRNYEYWLMSSSLCNERDLEKFLIDNIKV